MNWAKKLLLKRLLKRVERDERAIIKFRHYLEQAKIWKKQSTKQLNKELKKLTTEEFYEFANINGFGVVDSLTKNKR